MDITGVHFLPIFAIANPSVVCNVRAPYPGVETFGNNYFFAILYLSHPMTSVQNFTEFDPGELNARGVAK